MNYISTFVIRGAEQKSGWFSRLIWGNQKENPDQKKQVGRFEEQYKITKLGQDKLLVWNQNPRKINFEQLNISNYNIEGIAPELQSLANLFYYNMEINEFNKQINQLKELGYITEKTEQEKQEFKKQEERKEKPQEMQMAPQCMQQEKKRTKEEIEERGKELQRELEKIKLEQEFELKKIRQEERNIIIAEIEQIEKQYKLLELDEDMEKGMKEIEKSLTKLKQEIEEFQKIELPKKKLQIEKRGIQEQEAEEFEQEMELRDQEENKTRTEITRI